MPSVLILGAGSDMAVAIARAYASQKFDILLAARSGAALIPFQQDLQIRFGVHATVHDFDATTFHSHAAFYEQLPVIPDITICVFGYLGDQEKAETNWLETERIINSNYTGAVSILNIIAESYIAKGSGLIIGISSVAGERGRMSNYIYGSAKAGFTAYLSGLRNRLFHKGIHVMSVQPGFVNTRMTQHLTLPPLLTAQPEDIAKALFRAAAKKKNTIFIKWHWKYIMLIIRNIPEGIFKKLKL
ncbi:SDR family oxidoreductase [Chitinophaga sp. Hz27]|uniref:SDR family oxidoreductase n=1 Tax=Chitinophaga sp. Hz27 TaxID=3347169 RepID=UPI0035E3696B